MPGATTNPEDGTLLYTSEVRVRATGGTGKTDDELLALIKKKASDPTVFDEKAPFTWRVEASSSRLDSYYTRMDEQSLKNYAKDATDGVMFLDSHVKRQLGYGQSVHGEYVAGDLLSDKNPSRMHADFFTIPGIKLNAVDTDSFIDGVRSGVIRDVSIGFIPESFECSVCGRDPFDWWSMDCMHIPGAYYDKTGKEVTSKSKGEQAFAWVRNARLSEVSAVFDGATPGAHIEKAKYLVERGELSRADVTCLERSLRVRLPTAAILVPSFAIRGESLVVESGEAIFDGVRYTKGMEVEVPKAFKRVGSAAAAEQQPSASTEEERAPEASDAVVPTAENERSSETQEENVTMTEEQIRALEKRASDAEQALNAIRVAARSAGAEGEDEPVAVITHLRSEVARLTPLAQDGVDYRAATITEALAEGVRAFGAESFDEGEYRTMLEGMAMKHIILQRDNWKKIGDASITGGRKTTSVGNEPQKASTNGRVDQSQYVTRR